MAPTPKGKPDKLTDLTGLSDYEVARQINVPQNKIELGHMWTAFFETEPGRRLKAAARRKRERETDYV